MGALGGLWGPQPSASKDNLNACCALTQLLLLSKNVAFFTAVSKQEQCSDSAFRIQPPSQNNKFYHTLNT